MDPQTATIVRQKLIERGYSPEEADAGIAGYGNQTQQPSLESFNFDINKNPMLNMLLTQGLLSGDVSAADIGGLQSLGRLEKPPTATQIGNIRSQQNQLMTSLADIDDAIKLMEENKGKNLSGIIQGIKSERLGGVGLTGDSAKLNALFSKINQRVRAIAGAAFTRTESELYAGGVPTLKDDEDILLDKLKELKRELAREQELIVTLPGADPKRIGTKPRDDVETTTKQPQIRFDSQGRIIPSSIPSEPETPIRETRGGDKPIIGGALGGLTGGLVGALLGPVGSIGGAAAGTGAGMAMENLIRDLTGRQTQDELTQVKQMLGESGKAAGTAAAFELLLPFLFPKIPTARRDLFAAKSPLKIGGEEVAERVIEQLPGKLPVGTAGSKTVTSFVDDLINRFGGKTLSLPEAMAARSQAGKAAYTLSGQAGRPVLSQLNRLLGSSLRTGIRGASPSVGLMDDLLSLGLRGRKAVGGLVRNIAPAAATAGILGKLLGQ